MIDIVVDMMNQTFQLIIPITVIMIAFEFLGSFIFGKR